MRQYWLMKCEAGECTFEDLYSRPSGIGAWRGVRNYEARNNIRSMQKHDLVLFYQSSCPDPGIAGIAEVVAIPYPDPSALDPAHRYFDEKSNALDPRWFSVDIKPRVQFARFVFLSQLKEIEELAEMRVIQRGQRLSVQRVTEAEFGCIRKLGGRRRKR